MEQLRPAVRADAWPIRRLIWRVGINPTGLDWRRFVVLVDEQGQLLACAQIKPHGDGSRELASLAVIPERRGQGCARRLIDHLQAANPPPLHLTCARRLRPFYEGFGFRVLAPREMPPNLRRLHQLMTGLGRLAGQPEPMLVMRWDGKQPQEYNFFHDSTMRA